jgi:hypothetical protein
MKGESRLAATLSFMPDYRDGPRKVEIRLNAVLIRIKFRSGTGPHTEKTMKVLVIGVTGRVERFA